MLAVEELLSHSDLLERVPFCQTGLPEQVAFEEVPHVGSDLLKRALLYQTDLLEPERLCQTGLLTKPSLPICCFGQLEQVFLAHFDLPSQDVVPLSFGLPLLGHVSLSFDQLLPEVVPLSFDQLVLLLGE